MEDLKMYGIVPGEAHGGDLNKEAFDFFNDNDVSMLFLEGGEEGYSYFRGEGYQESYLLINKVGENKYNIQYGHTTKKGQVLPWNTFHNYSKLLVLGHIKKQARKYNIKKYELHKEGV